PLEHLYVLENLIRHRRPIRLRRRLPADHCNGYHPRDHRRSESCSHRPLNRALHPISRTRSRWSSPAAPTPLTRPTRLLHKSNCPPTRSCRPLRICVTSFQPEPYVVFIASTVAALNRL